MASLPKFRACIVAEQIRPEADNKSTILGFFGISPTVRLGLPAFPTTVNLAFMIICEPMIDEGSLFVEVQINGPEGVLVSKRELPNVTLAPQRKRDSVLILNAAALPVELPGLYSLELFSSGAFHSSSSFECERVEAI